MQLSDCESVHPLPTTPGQTDAACMHALELPPTPHCPRTHALTTLAAHRSATCRPPWPSNTQNKAVSVAGSSTSSTACASSCSAVQRSAPPCIGRRARAMRCRQAYTLHSAGSAAPLAPPLPGASRTGWLLMTHTKHAAQHQDHRHSAGNRAQRRKAVACCANISRQQLESCRAWGPRAHHAGAVPLGARHAVSGVLRAAFTRVLEGRERWGRGRGARSSPWHGAGVPRSWGGGRRARAGPRGQAACPQLP